jgi:hypothetical protein
MPSLARHIALIFLHLHLLTFASFRLVDGRDKRGQLRVRP